MTHLLAGQQRRMKELWVVGGVMAILCSGSPADAKSSSASSGKPPKPTACEYRAQPSITSVSPNHVKPGQKIMISGKNFGTKHCFHSVSFGSKSTDAWTYLNPTSIEATVPNLKPGAVPVTVSTEAGTSQFQVDVQAK